MSERGTQSTGARLSWDGAHRLEVLLRTRSLAMTARPAQTCAACGAPLGDDGMRVAGLRVHPACLPGAAAN
jgi:hypothetical protein